MERGVREGGAAGEGEMIERCGSSSSGSTGGGGEGEGEEDGIGDLESAFEVESAEARGRFEKSTEAVGAEPFAYIGEFEEFEGGESVGEVGEGEVGEEGAAG